MPDPVNDYLYKLNTSDRARDMAWEAVYAFREGNIDENEFNDRLYRTPFSEDVRDTLWAMGHGEEPPAIAQQGTATNDEPSGARAAVSELAHQTASAGSEFLRNINPVPVLMSANRAVSNRMGQALPEAVGGGGDPMGALRGTWSDIRGLGSAIGSQNQELYNRAAESFRSGDPAGGVAHGVNYVLNGIPGVGAALDEAGTDFREGRWGEGVGGSVGVGVGLFGPTALARSRIRTPAPLRNANPADVEALNYARRAGIEPDLSMATSGHPVARAAQHLTDRSIGGSIVADSARRAQVNQFRNAGQRLVDRARPGAAAATPETAGAAIRSGVQSRAAQYARTADAAYDELRALERSATPEVVGTRTTTATSPILGPGGEALTTTNTATQSMRLAVDVRAARTALRPLYEEFQRAQGLGEFMSGSKARAYNALDRLMKADDFAPLSVVDSALSDIKGLLRSTSDLQARRVYSQAINQLESQVTRTAMSNGVMDVLQRGRTATVARHRALDLLDSIRDEPVQAFNRATMRGDAGVEHLRAIHQMAPEALPEIGRAYLDDLMTQATSAGAFDRGQGLWARWQAMGPETKLLLFQDRSYVRDLDNFFLLAKRAAENPNPSGTGPILSLGAQGYWLLTDPATGIPVQIGSAALAKVMHSRAGVDALTRGLNMSPSSGTAARMTALEILSLAGERGAGSMVPALVDSHTPAPTDQDPQGRQP